MTVYHGGKPPIQACLRGVWGHPPPSPTDSHHTGLRPTISEPPILDRFNIAKGLSCIAGIHIRWYAAISYALFFNPSPIENHGVTPP